MVGHSLAARSLRHLRFARQMMVGQPLLAHASEGRRPGTAPAYVALDGRELPVGHILRRLPRQETYEASWVDGATTDTLRAREVWEAPAEATLRLLPPLSAPDEYDASTDIAPMLHTPQSPHIPEAPTPIPAPARPDGLRPRSRIVELPGVIVQPVEPENDESDGGVEIAESSTPSRTQADAQPSAQQEHPALAQDESPLTPQPAVAEPQPQPAPPPRRQRGKRSAQPPRASDALFPPTDTDRSPQSWLARLQQGQRPAPATQTAPAQPTAKSLAPTPDDEPPARGSASRRRAAVRTAAMPAPEKPAVSPARRSQPSEASDTVERPAALPASSRALLHKATGVDPASVRIYRGVEAARVTSAQNADALTDGESVALGAGHATDAPETLGLLAHELTHVAQRRAPRFIPPAAQAASSRRQTSMTPVSGQPQLQAQAQPATMPPTTTSPADEEAQATLVEARVTQVARAQQAVSFTAPVVAPEQPNQPEQRTRRDPRKQSAQPDTRPLWGGLPAPWEPLPDWLASPTDAPGTTEATAGPAPEQPGQRAAVAQSPAVASGGASSSASVPGVQRAERGRTAPTTESEAVPPHEGKAPEPDLDALAQQVHAILKRRLAAERRRFG